MTSIIFLGLLIGMQHALEADHVAAVCSLVSRDKGLGGMIRHGAFWGIGHAVTLVLFAGTVVIFGLALSDQLASKLEMVVGLMLVGLGSNVIYRLFKERVHFHPHHHADGVLHIHAHSHDDGSGSHDRFSHDHEHIRQVPLRTLLVGMMHGLAGSAALVVLASSIGSDPLIGVAYVFLFGLGSFLGMVLLSVIIVLPLHASTGVFTWAHRSLRGGIGAFTIALGIFVIIRSLQVAGLS